MHSIARLQQLSEWGSVRRRRRSGIAALRTACQRHRQELPRTPSSLARSPELPLPPIASSLRLATFGRSVNAGRVWAPSRGNGGAGGAQAPSRVAHTSHRQLPPLPASPAAATAAAPDTHPPPPCLQVAHSYVKQRRQFGRHPHFTDQGAEVRGVGGMGRRQPQALLPSTNLRPAALAVCSCCWTCGPMRSTPRRGS
jgi:hypothetical protein